MTRSPGVAVRMFVAIVLGIGSVAAGPATATKGADEPRDEPFQLLQDSGETRTVQDQTGRLVWAVVDGWDLDQYLFRDASPLNFAIDVDRDFGPVDAAGHPVQGNALYGLTGRISVRVFDVDDDAPTTPEIDHLYVNGELLGTLSGADNQWSINTFEFPLSHLLLPTTSNPEGQNDFHVDIDTTNSGWAVEVDWAELRLNEDFRPLAMIHGYTSSGDTWGQFSTFIDQNSVSVDAEDIITPTHSSTNIETSVAEVEPRINELLTSAGAHHLDIVSHSMGGLISRLYAWDNPSRVDKLIMIGTPNGGTELADAFCLLVDAGPFASAIWFGQLFDEQFGPCAGPEDAAFQLQTSYIRNVFNVQVRDREGTEYWVIGGAIPEDAERPWGIDPFPGADDGIVPLDSAQYLLIGRPDHPGKHRLLGTLPLEHGALIQGGSEAMPLSACELYGEQCDAQSASLLQAPAAEPSDQVIREIDGTQVAPGGNASVDLAFEGADAATVVLISDQIDDITPTLAEATFRPGKLLETDVLVAELASPADGQLQIANAGADTASVVAFVGVPAGRALEVTTSEFLSEPSSPLDIAISLSEAGSSEIAAAQVTAPSGAVTTVGLTPTATGTWTGSFAPSESGAHSVAAWVEGSRPRFDSTLFTVSSGVAQLTGAFSERLEGAGDGLADALVIAPDVTVSTAGRYRLAADLADPSGSVIASAGAVADVAVGTSSIDLGFAGRSIFDAGEDGPYRVVNVALSRDDAGLTLEDYANELGSTASYPYSEFDHFPILFDLDSFTDAGIDANNDEVFESLNVAFSVSVETAGSYAVNARLLGPSGTEIAETQSTPTLVAGSNQVELVFDAEAIAASGLDGPYEIADLSVYPLANADVLGYLVSAHMTGPYTAAQFGGSGPWPTSVRINNDTGAQTQQERPAVVIAPDGAVHAIWDDMRNGNQTDVYFSRRDPATGTWSPNQKVNNDTTTRAQYRAAIAVDGSNNAYAVWHDQREGNQSGDANIYFAKRPAGTGTWGANLRVNNDTKGASQTAPRIAVTSAGEAVAVWVDRRSSQWNIYSSRLPAGSSTWGANLRVTDNTSSRKDAPDLSIAPDGTVYAVWEDDRSGNWDIFWSKLTPGSSTWTANARLSDDPGAFAQYSAVIGSDAAGNVLAAWLDDRAPNTEVRVRRLPAGGGTWGPSQVASDAAADLPSDLALGVAPSGQALAAWADGRGTNWDIWGAEYNPTSQQWSVSRQISDDPGTSHQMRPAVAVRGNVSVAAWFDARESYFGDIRATTR